MSEPSVSVYSRVGRLPALDSANAPLARCGHSLTACVGENSRKLILFGGATALENSSGGGPATGIRLAGATADVHCFDIPTGTWTKLAPLGEAPSPRAAHAAAAVGSMVVMQARCRCTRSEHLLSQADALLHRRAALAPPALQQTISMCWTSQARRAGTAWCAPQRAETHSFVLCPVPVRAERSQRCA